MKRAAAAWLVLGALAALAAADRVVLTDGRVFEGKVTETEGKVFIALTYGTVSFPASEVEDIVRMPTPAELLEWRLSQIDPTDADALFQVAEWARENDLPQQAEKLLGEVLALNADHALARKLLGHVRADGKWLKLPEALQLARGKLEAGEYKVLQEKLLPAIEELVDDARLRLEVKDLQAHCRLRGRQFDAARKCFEALAEKAPPADVVRYSTVADILAKHPDGMYLVTESYPPLAMLLGSAAPPVQPGPASLSRPEVLAVALRDRAKEVIKEGRDLMDQAKALERTEPEAAKACYARAGKRFDVADALVHRIARSYRVEIVRRLVAMIRDGMNVDARKFDILMAELGKRNLTPAAYRDLIARMLRALSHVRSDLNAILELAQPFEREFVLEVTDAKLRLQRVSAMREVLSKEIKELSEGR